MAKVVEMFRTDQYADWSEAEKCGGVYSTVTRSGETVSDVIDAIHAACGMMDGGYCIATRVSEEAPAGFDEFYYSYCRHFSGIDRGRAIVAITQPDRPDVHAESQVRDAWFLWNDARKI